MNDNPLSRRDEFLRHGIPRDVVMHYARKAHDLRQQAFRDALTAMLRCIGLRRRSGKEEGKSMTDEKAFSGSILRVFEARAKPGCADSLAKKFATTSVDVVRNQPGNQGHFFGKSVSDEDDVLLFVSVWRDLNAVKTRFGDDWKSSFLPAGYSELIEECSVKHFALRTDWHSGE